MSDYSNEDVLRHRLKQAYDIIIWMSGSSDFAPGGTAHEGWLKQQYDLEKIADIVTVKQAVGD